MAKNILHNLRDKKGQKAKPAKKPPAAAGFANARKLMDRALLASLAVEGTFSVPGGMAPAAHAADLGASSDRKDGPAAEALGSVPGQGAELNSLVAPLATELSDPDAVVRKKASRSLRELANNGADMRPALAQLATALSDPDVNVQINAGFALMDAAKVTDIRVVMPALAQVFSERCAGALSMTIDVLENAAVNETSRHDALCMLANTLSDSDPDVRWRSAEALGRAAERGADISAAMSALAKALSDGDQKVRDYASTAFVCAAANEKSHDAALSALTNALSNMDARSRAALFSAGIISKLVGMLPEELAAKPPGSS